MYSVPENNNINSNSSKNFKKRQLRKQDTALLQNQVLKYNTLSDSNELRHGRRQRIWQKVLERGVQTLTDQEILEICLYITNARQDTYNMAKILLKNFSNIADCISADKNLLMEIPGIGNNTFASFKVLEEFCHRFALPSISKRDVISDWRKIIEYSRLRIGRKNKEHVLSIFLNCQNQVIKDEIHQTGSSLAVHIYPEELVRRCVELSAHALIVVHNHPANNVTPSVPDLKNTQRLQQMLGVVNVTLHDHIIIGANGFFSFRAEKLLK